MQPVRIKAEDKVHADILALLHRCFAYMEARIDPPSSLHRLTEDGIAEVCSTGEVWTIGSPPIACIFLTDRSDRLYLGKLAVDPAHRGEGLARVMIDLAEQRAKFKGKTALELQTRIELVENHATFARLGFHKVAEDAHSGFGRPTGIVMQKLI